MVVGGIPAHAAYGQDSLFQLPCFWISLPGPCARELHPVIAAVRQIHAQAHSRGKMQRLSSMVGKPRTSGNTPSFCKDGIEEFQAEPRNRVLKSGYERGRLAGIFRIRGR